MLILLLSLMGLVYGLISYISIALLIVGYFVVKKWGDSSQEDNYNRMAESQNNNNAPSAQSWYLSSLFFLSSPLNQP